MSDPTLELERLHLWRGDRHVLRGVQFSLRSGELLQVTGANGIGKTSLLRTLCGLLHPEDGRVLFAGREIRQDLPSYHAQLGFLGHEPPLKSDLNAWECLHYWIAMRRRVTADEIDRSLTRVGADLWKERPIRSLSAGQKRRVALAGLALLEVPLWLLDEPATHLDSEGQVLVGQLIAEQLARGGLVVAAVHQELPISAAQVRRLDLKAA